MGCNCGKKRLTSPKQRSGASKKRTGGTQVKRFKSPVRKAARR